MHLAHLMALHRQTIDGSLNDGFSVCQCGWQDDYREYPAHVKNVAESHGLVLLDRAWLRTSANHLSCAYGWTGHGCALTPDHRGPHLCDCGISPLPGEMLYTLAS